MTDDEFLAAGAETSLAKFLVDLMAARGLSQRGLARELDLSPNTINRLVTTGSVPQDGTLEKIAGLADLPITHVREIAERAPGEPERFTLPREFDQLNARQRKLMIEMGWAFLDAQGKRVTR